MAVSGYPYGYKFWGSQADDTKGSYAAWWPYEQTGYWIDGALKCGYLAGDNGLYHQALEEVDFAIDHAAPDGFIGPDSLRDKDRRGTRTVQGDFQFTPPLPDPQRLPERLSSAVEEVELIPYAATLLRVTVFPKG